MAPTWEVHGLFDFNTFSENAVRQQLTLQNGQQLAADFWEIIFRINVRYES